MLIVLCGIPASGKTTVAKKFEKTRKIKRHSYDDVNNYKKWIDNIMEDLQNKHSVVCDSINLTVQDRTNLLNDLSVYDGIKILIECVASCEECLRRNKQRKERLPDFVITQSIDRFEIPTNDEGWDLIFKIQ